MARVNGQNSDYKLVGNSITEVKPRPEPLFMELFICPKEAPNQLESEKNTCDGTTEKCPLGGDGHARIRLHEGEGIELRTDNGNRILIGQDGVITIGGENSSVKVVVNAEGNIELSATDIIVTGNMNVTGELKMNGTLVATE